MTWAPNCSSVVPNRSMWRWAGRAAIDGIIPATGKPYGAVKPLVPGHGRAGAVLAANRRISSAELRRWLMMRKVSTVWAKPARMAATAWMAGPM